jgi:hypothetical protein
LVGSTINCADINGNLDPKNNAHVQSPIFCIDSIALNILIEKGIFSKDMFQPTKTETIINCEIRMSREIISSGYNIACLIDFYKNVDFRFKDTSSENFQFYGYPFYNNFFENAMVLPSKILFVKTNRNIDPKFYTL